MRALVDSLSLISGAALIAVLSVAAVLLLCLAFPAVLRRLWVIIVPFILAYCLYWLPVWLGAGDVAQYHAWAGLVIGTWFLAGAIPSGILVYLLERRKEK